VSHSSSSIDLPPGDTPGRRIVPGLRNPFPMINYTSALLQGDRIAQMLCASLDDVLAPVISVLDCYDSYLDPFVAPIDFVRYMSSWILVHPELGWDEEAVRKSLAHAMNFYSCRGTASGYIEYLSTVFDIDVEVTDTGSVTTSRDFTDPSTWPTAPEPAVTVTVRGRDGAPVNLELIRMVLGAATPAHVEPTLVEGSS